MRQIAKVFNNDDLNFTVPK